MQKRGMGMYKSISALYMFGCARQLANGFKLVLLVLLTLVSCKRFEHAQPSAGSIDALVIDYLGRKYEQPRNGAWEDYKTYFLPEDPGLKLLGSGTNLDGLRIYRASVWVLHWVPEEIPILVWTVSRHGDLQMGVFEEAEQIKTTFPPALKGITFESPGPRKDLAVLLGEMVTVFKNDHWSGKLAVRSEGSCEWVERSGPSPKHRLAAACFSDKGALERIVLLPSQLDQHGVRSKPEKVPGRTLS